MYKTHVMRLVALALVSFILGLIVGGDTPTWLKIIMPALCVMWLSVYDDVRIERKIKEEEQWKNQKK